VKLPQDEEDVVDRATHDSEGWTLPIDVSAEVRSSLAGKGLIRYRQNRWQLTPLGFSHTPTFHRGKRLVGPGA
jgi:hypothetical protein